MPHLRTNLTLPACPKIRLKKIFLLSLIMPLYKVNNNVLCVYHASPSVLPSVT
jgi:hypothetical protein